VKENVSILSTSTHVKRGSWEDQEFAALCDRTVTSQTQSLRGALHWTFAHAQHAALTTTDVQQSMLLATGVY
jgi:hypothetical protein